MSTLERTFTSRHNKTVELSLKMIIFTLQYIWYNYLTQIYTKRFMYLSKLLTDKKTLSCKYTKTMTFVYGIQTTRIVFWVGMFNFVKYLIWTVTYEKRTYILLLFSSL